MFIFIFLIWIFLQFLLFQNLIIFYIYKKFHCQISLVCIYLTPLQEAGQFLNEVQLV